MPETVVLRMCRLFPTRLVTVSVCVSTCRVSVSPHHSKPCMHCTLPSTGGRTLTPNTCCMQAAGFDCTMCHSPMLAAPCHVMLKCICHVFVSTSFSLINKEGDCLVPACPLHPCSSACLTACLPISLPASSLFICLSDCMPVVPQLFQGPLQQNLLVP